jgi:hypothetical protein
MYRKYPALQNLAGNKSHSPDFSCFARPMSKSPNHAAMHHLENYDFGLVLERLIDCFTTTMFSPRQHCPAKIVSLTIFL